MSGAQGGRSVGRREDKKIEGKSGRGEIGIVRVGSLGGVQVCLLQYLFPFLLRLPIIRIPTQRMYYQPMASRSKSRDKYQRHFLDRSHLPDPHPSRDCPREHSRDCPKQWPQENEVSRLSQLEDKMRVLNGLDATEQGLLRDINSNNQRLQNIIASVRSLMKVDPKSRKPGVSPLAKPTQHRTNDRDKSSKRLIQRVEKAISDSHHFSK